MQRADYSPFPPADTTFCVNSHFTDPADIFKQASQVPWRFKSKYTTYTHKTASVKQPTPATGSSASTSQLKRGGQQKPFIRKVLTLTHQGKSVGMIVILVPKTFSASPFYLIAYNGTPSAADRSLVQHLHPTHIDNITTAAEFGARPIISPVANTSFASTPTRSQKHYHKKKTLTAPWFPTYESYLINAAGQQQLSLHSVLKTTTKGIYVSQVTPLNIKPYWALNERNPLPVISSPGSTPRLQTIQVDATFQANKTSRKKHKVLYTALTPICIQDPL